MDGPALAMTDFIPAEQLTALAALLAEAGVTPATPGTFDCLAGDGSDRRFLRFSAADGRRLMAALPSQTLAKGLDEARSAHRIGRHLFAAGVAVPEIIAFAGQTGILVMEDMGDTLLYHQLQRHPQEARRWYRQAIEALIDLQVKGRPGFLPEFCWDTVHYDPALMQERESGYFYQALCRDYLGMAAMPPELSEEFSRLAERAAQEPADFILHRDFQSRNLMVHQGRVRIIDFQGARFGPLAYDLAALLIDPYAGLSGDMQSELFEHYCAMMGSRMPFDCGRFADGYYYLALQRNLQMLGAFAFLSQQRGKPFFKAYIGPAIRQLMRHLEAPNGRRFPHLHHLARQAAAAVAAKKDFP